MARKRRGRLRYSGDMMPIQDLGDWLDEQQQAGVLWYVKRLSANDTQATGGHQAGFYVPKHFAFRVFPSLNNTNELNPRVEFELRIDSHINVHTVRAIWYNNRYQNGTRDEARITGLGGNESPLLDSEATGALVVFAFRFPPMTEHPVCHVWVCDNAVEEDRIEDRIGPVLPGKSRIWPELLFDQQGPRPCWLEPNDIPHGWLKNFPTGEEMISKTVELRPELSADVDWRLTRRHECEYELFRSVEKAVEFSRIKQGYPTMGAFLDHAQSVLQRRKSRAGRSLELHVRHIFYEEDLVEEKNFSYQPTSEAKKRPDFLFPNAQAYHDPFFPSQKLMMLAVKTSLRDRWRQVLEEAERIETKHLLTLDEGISETQFQEIDNAGIRLVAPRPLHSKYPQSVQSHLQTLESFLGDVRLLVP